MATLLDLVEQGQLSKLDAALRADQEEWRRIYVFPRARLWMETRLPLLQSVFEMEISPIEQLDAFLTIYCSGEILMYERQFHPLRQISSGVWELKTRDLRLFGWFHQKDCFVCTSAEDATRAKEHGLYAGHRDQAIRDRERLALDEPKYIKGGDPNDVVSAFCFPSP